MTICDMRGLMGDDALQRFSAFKARHHARVQKDRIGIDHKGIWHAAVDQQNLNTRRAEPCGLQNRARELG